MALKKIRRANKSWKHEQRRKKRQLEVREATRKNKIIQKRTRKMMIEGRREHQAQRRAEAAYIGQLTDNLIGGENGKVQEEVKV